MSQLLELMVERKIKADFLEQMESAEPVVPGSVDAAFLDEVRKFDPDYEVCSIDTESHYLCEGATRSNDPFPSEFAARWVGGPTLLEIESKVARKGTWNGHRAVMMQLYGFTVVAWQAND